MIAVALRITEEADGRAGGAARATRSSRRGLLDEMRGLLARGVPETALPFTGLVYRQALEHLHGVRDEAATRELDRPREPEVLAAAVDLVPERA